MCPGVPGVPRWAWCRPSISLETLPAALQGFLLPSTGACWQRSFHGDDETRPVIPTEALEDTPCLWHSFCPWGTLPGVDGLVHPLSPVPRGLTWRFLHSGISVLPGSRSRAPHWSSLHHRHSSTTSLPCWFTGWMVLTSFSRTGNTSFPGDIPFVCLKPCPEPPGGHPAGTTQGSSGFQLGLASEDHTGKERGPGWTHHPAHLFPRGPPGLCSLLIPLRPKDIHVPLLVYVSGPPAPPLSLY